MRENAQFKREARLRRAARVRKKVAGTASRPRIAAFRSNKHIFAQLIDDEAGITLASASSIKMETPSIEGMDGKVAKAKAVGLALAKLAGEKGVKEVVFDRAGFEYHGRIAALADGVREGGLQF